MAKPIMQRLILEYSIGDEYTYSAECTFPLVYEDKARAINDLELLIIEYLDNKEKNDKAIKKLQSLGTNILKKINAQQNKKSKEITKLCKDYKENALQQNEIIAQLKDDFVFGGQTFYFQNFISSDGKNIQMPNIFTIDEFFANVEKKLDP